MKVQQPSLPGMPQKAARDWTTTARQAREASQARASVTLGEAAAELSARIAARRSLLEFTRFTLPAYVAEPAHTLMASALDRVVEGKTRRLMIIAPPQHGKSELTSVRLPAFWLGRRPDDPVIISSYGYDLASTKSRQARAIVESEEFQTLFPGITVHGGTRLLAPLADGIAEPRQRAGRGCGRAHHRSRRHAGDHRRPLQELGGGPQRLRTGSAHGTGTAAPS